MAFARCRLMRVSIRPERRWAWHGPSFLVVDHDAECRPDASPTGFYFREVRHLSVLRLTVDGEPPWRCDIGEPSNDELVAHYVYPEHAAFSGGGSGRASSEIKRNARGVIFRSIELRLRLRVRFDSLQAELDVTNASPEAVDLDLAWMVDADFADLIEVQANARSQSADIDAAIGDTALDLAYRHPSLPFRTRIAWHGAATWCAKRDRIDARLHLDPRSATCIGLTISASDGGAPIQPNEIAERELRLASWRSMLASYAIPSNRVAERVIAQAIDDLAAMPMLEGPSEDWLIPQAGMPLYPAVFGRDALTASWQAASLDRGEMLDASLSALTRTQGTHVDPARDEEPGRIVQQIRRGPLSRLGLLPFARYYGDFASPLMFVISLAHLYVWTGDKQCVVRHWDAARRILDWARDYGDRDGDGYLEYLTTAKEGPKNQGWKDSGDGIIDQNGTIVESPIAACEIQGYWFAAQQLMAALSAAQGQIADAKAHWAAANDLKARFNRDWWMPDEGFFALALGPNKELVRSVTSNVGHCLATGIIDDEHIPRVVGRLFAPDMFSGWGIRTLSSDHPSYNALSYHLGSVWGVENATIAFGLRRFGFDARALELAHAMFDLAEVYGNRVPECVGGHSRGAHRHEGATRTMRVDLPGTYPRSNSPQTWNASGMLLLMHVILGLQPVGPLHTLVVDPALPRWMPEVTLHDLRIGDAIATVRFWRDDDAHSHAELVRSHGTIHLVRQPPIESLRHGVGDRFKALLDGLVHG
jgi:glycogen debranching enzyme